MIGLNFVHLVYHVHHITDTKSSVLLTSRSTRNTMMDEEKISHKTTCDVTRMMTKQKRRTGMFSRVISEQINTG